MVYLLIYSKNPYDEDDYLAFNFADDFEEETFSGPAVLSSRPVVDSRERFHKPRRKRKRRRRRTVVDVEGVEVELGPDDLPPQARWTIMITAIILLAMSLALVGVTLRMAPIIDEMGECLAWEFRMGSIKYAFDKPAIKLQPVMVSCESEKKGLIRVQFLY